MESVQQHKSLHLTIAGVMAGSLFLSSCGFSFASEPPSIVKVLAGPGHGSGVAVSKDSILTARHVVEGLKTLSIESNGTVYEASVVWVGSRPSIEGDLALLKINGKPDFKAATVNCDKLKIGDAIYTWGYPLNFGLSSSAGRVVNADNYGYVIGSAVIAPGSSGGPLLNKDNDLIGINVAIPKILADGVPVLLAYVVALGPQTVCEALGR